MVYGVIQACQILLMLHITLIKQWDAIPIDASSSLDHYTTDEVSWFKLLVLPINRVRAEYVMGVVRGHTMVYRLIHPCQTLSMPHITPRIKWLYIISINVSSSLDHYDYTTDD